MRFHKHDNSKHSPPLIPTYGLNQDTIEADDFDSGCDCFVEQAHRFRMQGVRYAIFDSKTSGAKFSLKKNDVQAPAGDRKP